MNDMIEAESYSKGNETLRIFYDPEPNDPREWDNLGTMVCNHGRYTLGDVQWEDDFNDYLESEGLTLKDIIALPLYLYDHSGITMSTGGFIGDAEGWDTSLVGIIYVTKEKAKKELVMKRFSKKKVIEGLTNEVKTYAQYLEGDVYGFQMVKNSTCDQDEEHEEITDSCWGYWSIEDIKTELNIDETWN